MRSHKPDPYNGFKNDTERRRALNFKALCGMLTATAVAACSSGFSTEALLWLKTLFL
jgi:hypothetical protein